jgi:hypothetical protein
MWPLQRWADSHPAQGLLFGVFWVVLPLVLAGLAISQPGGPAYFYVAFYAFLAARAAWMTWRQYERISLW